MKIPEPTNSIVAMIDKFHEQKKDKPRMHFGLSQVGHSCERFLWLSFRWATKEEFSGRMLRLFRRGQMEEDTIVQDLRNAGIDVRETGKDQRRVSFDNHISGSIDGIIVGGVPESPHKPHILEMKTHSKKSFDDLEKHGVQKSKPMHYAQMQTYMLGAGIDRALYFAICKDDDRIYTERVRLDIDYAKKMIEKARRITTSDSIPAPLSTDPSWYECKFCPAHILCHGKKNITSVNCRTCIHSTAKDDNTWHCSRWDATIPEATLREGCDSHIPHPNMVPEWEVNYDKCTETTACFIIDGDEVMVGEDGMSTRELFSAQNKDVRMVLKVMGGEVMND